MSNEFSRLISRCVRVREELVLTDLYELIFSRENESLSNISQEVAMSLQVQKCQAEKNKNSVRLRWS